MKRNGQDVSHQIIQPWIKWNSINKWKRQECLFETSSLMPSQKDITHLKILSRLSFEFIGDEGVGKTSLIHRFTTGKWLMEPIRSLDLQVTIVTETTVLWKIIPLKMDIFVLWHINVWENSPLKLSFTHFYLNVVAISSAKDFYSCFSSLRKYALFWNLEWP